MLLPIRCTRVDIGYLTSVSKNGSLDCAVIAPPHCDPPPLSSSLEVVRFHENKKRSPRGYDRGISPLHMVLYHEGAFIWDASNGLLSAQRVHAPLRHEHDVTLSCTAVEGSVLYVRFGGCVRVCVCVRARVCVFFSPTGKYPPGVVSTTITLPPHPCRSPWARLSNRPPSLRQRNFNLRYFHSRCNLKRLNFPDS